jgi:hypothetical protein
VFYLHLRLNPLEAAEMAIVSQIPLTAVERTGHIIRDDGAQCAIIVLKIRPKG